MNLTDKISHEMSCQILLVFHGLLIWMQKLIHIQQYKSTCSFRPSTSIYPSISIFRLRCCPCPILWGWQHQVPCTMSNTSSPCIFVMWVNASQATLIDISLDTYSDHVFLGLPYFLVPGIGKFLIRVYTGHGLLYMATPYNVFQSCV